MQLSLILSQTHNVHVTKPIADFVVSIASDGRIASQGSLSSALSKNKKLAHKIKADAAEADKVGHTVDEPVEETADGKKSDGKLIVAEEISVGHVGWPARTYHSETTHAVSYTDHESVKLYFANLGGDSPIIFWTLFLGGMILTSVTETFQAWYLGYWAQQYETHDPSEVNVI